MTAWQRGSYPSCIGASGLVICLSAVLVAWIIKPNVMARATFNVAGTTIRPDHRVDKVTIVCLVAGAMSLGSLGVLGVTGNLDFPMPPDIARMYTLIFVVAAAGFFVAIGCVAWRRGIGYVRLTVDGFEFVETFRARRGEWSQVTAVTNENPGRRQDKSPLVMVMENGELTILSESAWYTPGGWALLELMRYYWQHPDYRVELSDGRAVERLHQTQVEFGSGFS